MFILPNYWQLDGVWLAFPITDALASILVLVLLIPEIKMFRRNEMMRVYSGLNPFDEKSV